jgi:hypothetical protein
MPSVYKPLLVATLFVVAGCSTTGGTRPSEKIEIKPAGDSYALSVPVSKLMMALPRGNWSIKDQSAGGGGTASPRYFYFEDRKEASLILSGWFEPDRSFTSVSKIWEQDTQAWKKRGLPEPVNVSFEKLGGWDAILYDHNFGSTVNSHLRAHWVQSGTWIDLHVSTTTKGTSAENRKRLRAVLRGISISEKDGG